jgi:hypothetical protein
MEMKAQEADEATSEQQKEMEEYRELIKDTEEQRADLKEKADWLTEKWESARQQQEMP